ncbi:MAG: lasso peptide biosynthesis B2 protein [Bacteroidota bacterium]
MNIIKKYYRINKTERQIFRQVFWYLFIAWWNTTFLPMRKYSLRLGVEHKESQGEHLPDCENYLLHLKTAIRRAARYAPFKSRCLQQACAGKIILKKKGIPSTIYFGVARDGKNNLKAHAWLRAGDIYISGGRERLQYTVVSMFS